MKTLISSALVLILMCSPLYGSPGPDAKHVEKIKERVAESIKQHRRIVVETYDKRLLQGSASEADVDSFVITNQSTTKTLMYADVKNIKLSSSGTSRHVKAIIGAAVVTGAILGLVVLLGGLRD